MATSLKQQHHIMIVDDDAGNLRVLHELLSKNDYEVHAVKDSRSVASVLESFTPDLFLLDIHMPYIGGFDLARMLKENPETSDIPIIFISASYEQEDIKQGFKVGGVDYITKPIRSFEVLARVSTHIRLQCQQLALAEKVSEIQQLRENEQDEFARLEEMRNQFLQAATHDLKNPLYNVISYMDLITEFGEELTPERLETFHEHIQLSTNKMRTLISDMLDLFHVNSTQLNIDLRPVNFGTFLQTELALFNQRAGQKQIKINVHHPDKPVHAYIDAKLFERVIGNLVSNAIKYSPEDTTITMRYGNIQHGVAIEIEDEGFGMSQETLENLFTAFYRSPDAAQSNTEGTGLGMAITRQIVELHGGMIDVTSQLEQGTIFRIILPHHAVEDVV